MADTAQMDEFQQMGLDQAQSDALEKDFQEVLNELVDDPNMEKFRKEYEKMHRAWKTSYESEKRLVRRCKELNDTILQNAVKVKGAIKLTQDDSSTIAMLRKEVEKCWKLVEAAKEKEEKARKIIIDLKEEIAKLHKIVEDGSGLSLGSDNQLSQMMKREELLTREVQEKNGKIDELETNKTSLDARIAKLLAELHQEKELVQAKNHLNEVLMEDQAKQKRQEKFFAEKETKLTKEKEKIMSDLEEMTNNFKSKDNENKTLSNHFVETQKKLEKEKETTTILQQRLRVEQESHGGTRRELDDRKKHIEELIIERDQFAYERSNLAKENNSYKLTNNKIVTERDQLAKQKNEAEHQKNITKAGVNALTREIEYLRKQADNEKTDILNLIRDRDMMGKYIRKASEMNEKNRQEIIKLNGKVNSLNEQCRAKNENIKLLLTQLYALEKEKDKASQEAQRANNNVLQLVEDSRLRQNMIQELKKVTIENDAKLKQQQALYEACRAERNLFSKNFIEQTDQVADLKNKFGIAEHQIQQLKNENQARQQTLATQISLYAQAKKEIDKINTEKDKHKDMYNKKDKLAKQLGQQIVKLEHLISLQHEEIERAAKAYKKTLTERDTLGTQLIRRNDELALLYEKIKILQSTLWKGELQYQQRLEDIRLLKFKIGDHKAELKIVRSEAQQIPELRKEIYNLQQMLLQERLQVKSLSEELENPLNVHRWNRLQGTDPDTWEMLQKIHTLQKRLIKKTEEVVERDALIQEKESLYVELKNLLARQPGPQVAEQLSIYQQNLKEKTSQMKAMAAELNMYQAQVNEYKYEIERLTRELQDMKRKYYEQKRREQMQREAQQRLEPKVINQANVPVQKFAGGGFNLAM